MVTDWVSRSETLTLRVRNFVDGRWRPVGGDAQIEKYGPRDGRLLCRFGVGAKPEIEEAVSVARRAFEDGRWSNLPMQRRKDVLHNFARLVEQQREELALLECLDVGKPISDVLSVDLPTTAAIIKASAEWADKLCGKVYAVDQANLSYQVRRPIGVVAGIIGWNFPIMLAASKIGPVLASGNCLVLKPSELTSFTAARIAELAVEAGVPAGVFNVVHGDAEMGAALAYHRDVDLLTFTGSTRTGKKLLIAAGRSNMKRLVLECGGKAPNIVFDDCPNLDDVVDGIVTSAFWNQGQVCSASSRLLVHESIKDELMDRLLRKVSTLKVGDPLHAQTKFGAVVSREHRQKVLSYIETGETEGARRVYHSSAPVPCEGGYYVAQTIFDNVLPGQRIAQEEIFGPVLSVLSFRNEEEAVAIANATVYGLSATIWTKDLGRAHRMTLGVKAGWIVVNATARPMGGPGEGVLSVGGHKESGLGVEGGIDGLESYTTSTAVQLFV